MRAWIRTLFTRPSSEDEVVELSIADIIEWRAAPPPLPPTVTGGARAISVPPPLP